MAKIVFNFFEAHMEDDEVSPFLKKIEEVLKKFAREASTKVRACWENGLTQGCQTVGGHLSQRWIQQIL